MRDLYAVRAYFALSLNVPLDRKPKLLVAITLANRMARGIWAMLMKQENYRNPEAMA